MKNGNDEPPMKTPEARVIQNVQLGLQTLDGGTHPLRNELRTTWGIKKIPLGEVMTVSHQKHMCVFY